MLTGRGDFLALTNSPESGVDEKLLQRLGIVLRTRTVCIFQDSLIQDSLKSGGCGRLVHPLEISLAGGLEQAVHVAVEVLDSKSQIFGD